jgi:ArsR family transcriptional regulator
MMGPSFSGAALRPVDRLKCQAFHDLTPDANGRTIRSMAKRRKGDIEKFAAVFAALSNPNRLELFRRLTSCCVSDRSCDGQQKTCRCVGDLTDGLDIAPSTASHHLKELRQAGLIRTRRRGRLIECWVDPSVLEDLRSFLDELAGR